MKTDLVEEIIQTMVRKRLMRRAYELTGIVLTDFDSLEYLSEKRLKAIIKRLRRLRRRSTGFSETGDQK